MPVSTSAGLSGIRKIAVIKPGALGDVLMTTPFIRAVRKRFPDARIDYYVQDTSKNLLEGNNNVDRIIGFPFFNRNVPSILKLIAKIRKEKYDITFSLDRHWKATVFAWLCRSPVRIGFDRNGEGFLYTKKIIYNQKKHDVLANLDLAYAVGAKKESADMELFISDEKMVDDYIHKNKIDIKKLIAIAPGGAKNPGQDLPQKLWPKENYVELIKSLMKTHHNIILIGGKGDIEISDYIVKNTGCQSAVGKLTIRQSAALLKRCRLLICNDSGPMHLAAAVGTPTLSIFGPTDPRVLAPLGKKHRYIWKHKVPCYDIYGRLKPRHPDCMAGIGVKDVLNAAGRF